jgi:DNA polymerase type B, organellar and viral
VRRAHWLKKNRTTVIPKHHICVATATRPSKDNFESWELDNAGVSVLTFQHGQVTHCGTQTLATAGDLWGFVEPYLSSPAVTWIWFLNPAQDWPALQLTALVKRGELERDWWVWGDGPVILPGKLFGKKVRLVSVGNWFGQVAAELPAIREDMPPLDQEVAWERTGHINRAWWLVNHCEALVKHVLTFVYREDLGHLCSTVGGQALQSFRHLHLHHDVLVDDSFEALQLERGAAIGFPVNCYAVGEYSEPIHVCDVNALYPWVMGQYPYPRKRAFYSRWNDVDQLKKAAEKYLLIARVSGEDSEQTYLVKRERKCVEEGWLEGDVLVGPDLDRALSRNIITRVHEVCAYEAAPIFDTWSPWAWELRKRYKDRGDKIDELIAKALTVSLWGKFAAQVGRWEPAIGDVPPSADYSKFLWHKEDGCIVQCRKVAGVVDCFADFREGANSIPCIAAFVAAYSRMTMNALKAIAGLGNLYYQCADAIHVNTAGLKNLHQAGLVQPDKYGKLKVAPTVHSATYHAANIYRHGSTWTWAGRKVKAEETEPGVWTWTSPPSLAETMMAPMQGQVPIVQHKCRLND